MRRAALRVGVAASAATAALVAAYSGSAQAHTDGLDDVRAATASFHSTSQAEAAGYGDPGLPCFDSPGTNQGMGFHLVNGDLLNDGGELSRTHPEALVYEMHRGTLQLVAVEYIVKMSAARLDLAEEPAEPVRVVQRERPALPRELTAQGERPWCLVGRAPRPRAGLATEALRLLSHWAPTDEMLRLVLQIQEANTASQALARRAGYTDEGTQRSAHHKNGERVELQLWSLLPSDLTPDPAG
jgi:hypothetical protein